MGRIVRELRSLPGAMLAIIILLMITFYVLNLIQTKAPAPISTIGGFALGRASGSVYSSPAAPALTTSAYSANNNLGPLL